LPEAEQRIEAEQHIEAARRIEELVLLVLADVVADPPRRRSFISAFPPA